VIDYPNPAQDWTLAAISFDFNGHAAADPHTLPLPDHIPTAIWHIGPPGPGGTGWEYTSLVGVAGVTIDTEQQLNSDGVVMMRHKIVGWTNPNDNSFGGVSIARVYGGDLVNATWWDAQKTDTSLTTPWEPAPGPRSWDFYFVSRNQQNKKNSILPGVTPKVTVSFTPMQGQIIPYRLPPGWWDPAEFQWPAYPGGYFQALQFVAKKIFVGSILRVGGGTGTQDATFGGQSNGQIAVYNQFNVLRGWIGQQDNTATPDQPQHSVFGAWFAELYLGGDGPPSAPIYAKQDGTVIVGGWDVQGTRYPYISIRDKTGLEVGRIGANVGINLVGSTDPAYIQGAWFRDFAFGGQGLSDWRFLAKYDAGTGIANVQMRNINKFWIDYTQNYSPPGGTTNPLNAANHLEFGYDTYITDVASSSYAKFPGMSLYRTGTTHGINLINRGLVLKNAAGLRVGALVSFNGDSLGGDTANGGLFWGALTLNNPNTGVATITLASGATGGSVQPTMFITDQTATITHFAVDGINAVTCRLGVTTGLGLVIDSSNNIMGTAIHSSSGYLIGGTGPSSSGTPVINTSAQFVGSGGINTAGAVTATGDITTSNQMRCQGIYVGGVQRCTSNGIWTTGVQANDHVYASDFGIYGVATGKSGTFTTTDGKTITVDGGIITGIA
jgi:hypothetical protein